MASRAEKHALFEAIALMGKAFASPRRLELLDLLAQAPRTVEELARASGLSTANTSQHLQALHAAGLVVRAREGTSVRYSLADDRALALWLALRDASIAQLAEVERAARADRPPAWCGRPHVHKRRTGRGSRPRPPGRPAARPAARRARRSGSIARPRCARPRTPPAAARPRARRHRAPAARAGLRDSGRQARRLEDGWPEWRLAGSPRTPRAA